MSKLASLFTEHTNTSLAQYMVSATAEDPIANNCLFGDIIASIDLTDSQNNIIVSISLLFTNDLASRIYEAIFGEVSLDELGEVTKEMVNIIGGNVKPELTKFSTEIFSKVHPNKPLPEGQTEFLKFDLGLPNYLMKDAHELKLPDKTAYELVIPFVVEDEEITLVVAFLPS